MVVAVLMKHLEESNKDAREDAEMDAEIELEMSRGAKAGAGDATPESRALHGNPEHSKGKLQALVRAHAELGWGGVDA